MREAFSGRVKRTVALLAIALAVRLFFALAYPHVGGDSPVYETFARNLLHFRVYSHHAAQNQTAPGPTMIRTPGYPIFLAIVFRVAGDRNETAVRVVQAALDTWTCLLIALLVFEMVEGEIARRRRLAQRALFLAAMCPFIADYAASILTEVPTTMLLTVAALCAVRAFKNLNPKKNWFWCGASAGLATLFRPESGLLLVGVGVVLVVREVCRHAWRSIVVAGVLMAFGLILPLLPWTARNLITLKTFQPLAPAYAQEPDEIVPWGYLSWCKTWLWKFPDVDNFLWTLEESEIPVAAVPPSAADNEPERRQVIALLERHNESTSMEPESDAQFAALATERRHRHPFRYYLGLPFLRGVAMWFTPRVELLPMEGQLLPIRASWENDALDFSFTLVLFVVNLGFIALAVVGSWHIVASSPGSDLERLFLWLLVSVILIRTIFFAYFTFPEHRYMLETYPALIALGAFAFSRNRA
jgi:4-amino-4-deoxy-L-arabinose transferase-like glycosyltransferase